LPNAFIIQDINYEGYTNLSPGDSLPILFSYKENNKWIKTEQNFVIMDTLDKAPVSISKGNGSIAVFMKEELLQKYYPTDGYQRIEIYLENGADVQAVEESLRDIASSQKYGKVDSFWEYTEMIRKLQTQLALVLYSIVVVISLVGLINIVNTMSMNILLRKREFGILRAMGVTKLQLREMIFKEGLLYGVIGSLFGSVMGIGLIYVIYSFGRKLLYVEFQINYLSIIFASTVTIILCITATLIPIKRVTAASVIESIGAVE
jgi:ABC-type antimicrobial peptide transport system permease subunit